MKWLPIPNYEGFYEVSKNGDVRSVDRILKINNNATRLFKGKIISALPNKNLQYLQVHLWKDNKKENLYVHRLVAKAFIPNPLDLPEVNHIDGNRLNNSVSNLEWCDRAGNARHAVETGLLKYSNRLTEEEFLDCLSDVINGESYASLSSRVPYKVPFLSTKLRKIARKYGLEDLLNESLAIQKANRARKNGNNNKRTSN